MALRQTQDAIVTFLSSKGLPPSAQWLQSFMQSIRPTTPLPALQQTGLFRLLASDLTSALDLSSAATLPANITNAAVKETRIRGTVVLQLLDIEDVGRSRWSQVEALDLEERGETTRGRQVIRVVPNEDDAIDANPSSTTTSATTNGPHKLLLQDATGAKVFAFELERVQGIATSMSIGSKLSLRNVKVARGVLMLEKDGVELLGGKIEAWDVKWRQDRKKVLKEKIGWTEQVAG